MLRGTASAVACLAVLCGCGSSGTTSSSTSKSAAIQAMLHQLEVGATKPRAGGILLIYSSPRKHVSRAEWEAAVRNDKALSPALRAIFRGKEGISSLAQTVTRTSTK
jgi:hypothetical protein